MKCEKARTLFPVFAAKRLQGIEKTRVESHVADCPDCSDALMKTSRLQMLLSLKRHEKPDEFFFRNYVPEFHRRLCADVVQKQSRSFWTKIRESFSFETNWIFAAQSFAAIFVLGIIAYHFYPAASSHKATIHQIASKNSGAIIEVESRSNELVLANNVAANGLHAGCLSIFHYCNVSASLSRTVASILEYHLSFGSVEKS